MKRMLCYWAILLACVPASAEAASQENINQYLNLARAHFALVADNCPNGVAVHFEPKEYFPYMEDREGTPWGLGGGCAIWLDEGFYATASWATACQLVVHETGHAYGLDHSHDPTNIMFGEVWIDWQLCQQLDPTGPILRALSRAEDRLSLWEDRAYTARMRVYDRRRLHAPKPYIRRAQRTLRHALREYRRVKTEVRTLTVALDAAEKES